MEKAQAREIAQKVEMSHYQTGVADHMSRRQVIKDKNYRVIGYIEDMADGRQKAMNANYHILGYYDPKTDVTQDAHYHIISHGNVLSALVYDNR